MPRVKYLKDEQGRRVKTVEIARAEETRRRERYETADVPILTVLKDSKLVGPTCRFSDLERLLVNRSEVCRAMGHDPDDFGVPLAVGLISLEPPPPEVFAYLRKLEGLDPETGEPV